MRDYYSYLLQYLITHRAWTVLFVDFRREISVVTLHLQSVDLLQSTTVALHSKHSPRLERKQQITVVWRQLSQSITPSGTGIKHAIFRDRWSICDFEFDIKGERAKQIGTVYFALMGPIPVFMSLLLISITNIVIVIYLMKRYKVSTQLIYENSRQDSV